MLSDGYNTLDNLTVDESKRLERAQIAFRIAKAELYGTQLSEIMDTPLELDLAKEPRVFAYLVTGNTTEINPDDREAMRSLTREVIESNQLAMRNLEFSSAARRQELEDEYLSSLNPLQRMTYFRDGSIEQRVSEYVTAKLDERFV